MPSLSSPSPRRAARIPNADLGFACIVLGCLWAISAVLLAVGTVPNRGRSALAVAVLACMVGMLGCAMLALACFPRFVQRLRILGWPTVVGGSTLALVVLCSAWQVGPDPLQWFATPGDARGATDLAVAWALIMLTCSVSLITARLLSHQASRHHFHPAGAVQAIFVLFWRQHRLVGWMALALSAAHSLYYLRFPRTFQEQWTGIAAFGLLGLLGLVGLVTSYRTQVALWVHRAIAALLLVLLTLHWPPILYAEVGALAVLGVTTLINLKLATAMVQRVLGLST